MAKQDRWPELCKLVELDDGLAVRECGSWTEDKLYLWHRYIEITTGGMKNLWPHGLTYVDLFAGPGILANTESGRRLPGSPLIAARASQPFTKIILVEKDHSLASACEQRMRKVGQGSVRVIADDCNAAIGAVIQEIDPRTLSLVFVDPEGLHVRFATLEAIAKHRRADLLILFPVGYDIIRNIKFYELQSDSKLDEALGISGNWRDNWEEVLNRNASRVTEFFVGEYKRRLRDELGYTAIADYPIRHKGRVFYSLVFASMHDRGLDFWTKAVQKERGGQMGLGF